MNTLKFNPVERRHVCNGPSGPVVRPIVAGELNLVRAERKERNLTAGAEYALM